MRDSDWKLGTGNSTLRAVLFDMDGVLLDSKEAWFQVLRAAARHFGTPKITRRRFDPTWGQGVEADVEVFFKDQTVRELEAYYARHFHEHVHHVSVHPDARRILQTLRRSGIRTAVITNTPGPLARKALRSAGLKPDLQLSPTARIRAKPEPDMLEEACRRLRIRCADAVMIGDSPFDRKAARAAGVLFVGYRLRGDVTVRELRDVLPLVLLRGRRRRSRAD